MRNCKECRVVLTDTNWPAGKKERGKDNENLVDNVLIICYAFVSH